MPAATFCAPRQNRKIGRAHHACLRLAGAATENRTMKAALGNYHARMQRVLDHID
jgi:AraC family transcriptional regulator